MFPADCNLPEVRRHQLPRAGSDERNARRFQNTAVRSQTGKVRRPCRRSSSPCTEAGGGWRGPAAGTASPHALASVRAFWRSRYEARRSSPLRIVTGGEWMFRFCFPGGPRGRRVLGALAGARCLRALGVAPGVSGQVGGTGRASLARYQRVWATACKLKFCNVITF